MGNDQPLSSPGPHDYRAAASRPAAQSDSGPPKAGHGHLEDLVADYIDRMNRGERLSPHQILADHPRLGPEILQHLESFLELGSDRDVPSSLRTLGDYNLLRRVGQGGMGVVYEAWETSMDRRVALKVLPGPMAADAKALTRFVREARAAGKLNHPNVVSVFGMGVKSDTPYYVMEFVAGETLAQILARLRAGDQDPLQEDQINLFEGMSELLGRRPQPESESSHATDGTTHAAVAETPLDRGHITQVYCTTLAEAFAGVAEGLEHAHENGVIHRDIKPSNLILDKQGRLRILDFGLARVEGQETLTLSRDFVGTPLYMSPEQAKALRARIDYRTDIYSLGATMYEMLTWRPPLRGKSHQDTLTQIINRDPDPLRKRNPQIPKDLETIVLKCLRKDSGERYGTAGALAQDLRCFVRGDPISACPQPGWQKLARRARRYKAPILACGVVLLLACAFLILNRPNNTPKVNASRHAGTMANRLLWKGAQVSVAGKVSPDGRYISYRDRETGDLGVYELSTRKERRLTESGSGPRTGAMHSGAMYSVFSPDSKQVAFAWRRYKDSDQLRIMELDGSAPRILYRNEEVRRVHPYAWSPDRQDILAVFFNKNRTSQIALVSVRDRSARVLKSFDWRSPRGMDFSPDGRYIVYEFQQGKDPQNHDLYLLATDASREIPLVEHPAMDRVLGWAPDGKRFLFLSDRSGTWGVWAVEVAQGEPQGFPEPVTTSLMKGAGNGIYPMGLTRQGDFYYTVINARVDIFIATLNPRTGKVLGSPVLGIRRHEGSNFDADWSPDGQYLAYISRRGPSARSILCIHSLETEKTEREISTKMTLSYALPPCPRWSPDGRSLLVRGYNSNIKNSLFRIDVQTGAATTVVEGGQGGEWTPDGRGILYLRDSSILRLDLETGQEKPIYRGVGLFAMSPDGLRLAFAGTSGRWKPGTDAITTLSVAPIAGGEVRELVRLEHPEYLPGYNVHTWTPDGRHILFAKWRLPEKPGKLECELWRVPADGGEPQPVGLERFRLRHPRVHPDGKRVVFTTGAPRQFEVWVLENFLPPGQIASSSR